MLTCIERKSEFHPKKKWKKREREKKRLCARLAINMIVLSVYSRVNNVAVCIWHEQEKPFSCGNYEIYLEFEFYVEVHFVFILPFF